MEYSPSPEEIVAASMEAAVPERRDEIRALWRQYHPKVIVAKDAKRVTLNATKDRIKFDTKTMEVFWLIGFSGWRAIECYSPHVIGSAASGQTVKRIIKGDEGLAEIERAYKERRAAAQGLIDAAGPATAPWPPDLPRPNSSRDAACDPQYKAAFDLTWLAVAFTLFHEFRHVILDRDKQRPQDLREEELACDVWAREFMTAKLAAYAEDHGHDHHEVLRKRSMGFALAVLILHEITPVWDHGGNNAYFSVQTRMQTILENTPLPDNDHFWVFAASLLIGIFRQRGQPISAPATDPQSLARHLLAEL
ncbi:peptidase U49, Lit peptidase [Salinisphaera aquimarina]|uniref:Peptidase U49, Lit peptidase n=1 Tax=Salinisphaera aquimarina TaxID=2094031 RepID=A0ABV7EM12_9GAMM